MFHPSYTTPRGSAAHSHACWHTKRANLHRHAHTLHAHALTMYAYTHIHQISHECTRMPYCIRAHTPNTTRMYTHVVLYTRAHTKISHECTRMPYCIRTHAPNITRMYTHTYTKYHTKVHACRTVYAHTPNITRMYTHVVLYTRAHTK